MPKYLYKFEDGRIVEEEQSIRDEPYTSLYHPEKNVLMSVKRVPQRPGASFKGGGWARKEKKK